ncbi:hypothetical protein ACFXKG_30545 [Streptomyces sp. NPDC059255]|uniref:hypothetical protein n=1 Tax=Streptomyces sp. NPDC059255 TaxID=3346793 RepID=UPI0036B5C321
MRKEIRNAIVVGIAVVMPLIAAGPAMANVTSCPSNGNPGGGQRCTTLSNGVLAVSGVSDGTYVNVNYYRASGGSLTGRLGWERNGTTTWAANRNMSTVPLHYSNQWGPNASCNPIIGKLNASGSVYVTPPLPQC